MKLAKSTGTFETAPEGTTQAVVVDVIDRGMQPGFEGKERPAVRLAFQTEDETSEGTPFLVQTFDLTASVNNQSKLYKEYIKPILGRSLDEDDFDSEGEVDLDELLIGKNVNITIEHKTKGDKTYANIVNVAPLNKKQTDVLTPRDYVRKQDRPDTDRFTVNESGEVDV